MKFIFGLIVGIGLGIGIHFIMVPKIREAASADGYGRGSAEGMAKGIEQERIQMKHVQDSLTADSRKIDSAGKKSRKPAKFVPAKNPYDVNFSVYGNQIGEEKK